MLNHVYRVISNRSITCCVAVSEIIKYSGLSAGKDGSIHSNSTTNVSTGKKTLSRFISSTAIAATLGVAAISSNYAADIVAEDNQIDSSAITIAAEDVDHTSNIASDTNSVTLENPSPEADNSNQVSDITSPELDYSWSAGLWW